VTLAIVALILGVLVVSGVMLVFDYRPNVTAAFAAVQGIPSHSQTRTVHRVAARALLPAFGCLAIGATGLALVRHRAWRLVAVAVAGVGVVTASVTGFLLPWDQINLTHVTVGTNISGYGKILFGNDVKYVFVGSSEIAPSTFARWFWIHVLVASLVVVVSLVIVALHSRSERGTDSTDAL
jgi:quinol-cytochrome oxidoreductase complex cytochrome b subunit